MKLYFHVNEFNAALKDYVTVCNKDMAKEINKTATAIAVYAMKQTPRRRDIWPVRSEDKPKLNSGRKDRASRLYFALAAKKGFKKAKSSDMVMKKKRPSKGGGYKAAKETPLFTEAKRIWGQRRRGKGYTAIGWAKSIRDVSGKSPRISGWRRGLHGPAKTSRPIMATVINRMAKIENATDGASKVGRQALWDAEQIVFNDRIQHIAAAIAKRALAASGTKGKFI